MTLPYGWIDVLSDGRPAIAIWQQPFFQFGADPQIPLTEYLMFSRARLLFGQGWAVGKGNQTGAAWVVREDGVTINLGPTFANYPVLIGQMGSDVAVVAQTGFTVYHTYVIDPVTLAVTDLGPTTITGSSQGFLDFDPSQLGLVPLPTDPTDRVINGYGCFYPTAIVDGIQAAQAGGALPEQMLGFYGSATGTLFLGPTFEPHLDPTGKWGCRRGNTEVSVFPIPAICPDLVQNPPGPTLPTFAVSTTCRWGMTSGDSNDPEDPANHFRVTTLQDTPAQQADPRNRAVYLEKDGDVAGSIALAVKLGLSYLIQNYDGPMPDLLTADAVWTKTWTQCPKTLTFLPCIEAYPGTTAAYLHTFKNLWPALACWFGYYRGITQLTPPIYTWTEQQVLDQQSLVWAALGNSLEFALRFLYTRGDGEDGIEAFTSFQQSAALMDAAAQGADIKPVPPHPSTAHPLALSLISGGKL